MIKTTIGRHSGAWMHPYQLIKTPWLSTFKIPYLSRPDQIVEWQMPEYKGLDTNENKITEG